jgi:phosphoribosylaminoimidazolecarboxamide formyltransferase/IMP cyclohydrolase
MECKKIALFSVNQLKDIVKFGRILTKRGWKIVATKSAYDALQKNRIAVTSVSDFVGLTEKYKFPPTLHPKMEAALTQDSCPQRIELVYDITYGPDQAIDVGGNTLLALAVKGRRIPVTSYPAMKSVTEAVSRSRDIPKAMRNALICDATKKIADYYNRVAESITEEKTKCLKLQWHYDLLNGENPYQQAALWSLQQADQLALAHYRLVSDNKPCFTNLADLDCITETMAKLASAFRLQYKKQPFITIAAKHGNACGIGVDWRSKRLSIEKALWGNPLAIWGGEVIVNFNLKAQQARYLVSSEKRKKKLDEARWILDVIAAPGINNQASAILSKRKNTKLFINRSLLSPAPSKGPWSYRFTRGGIIKQSIADYCLDIQALHWTQSLGAAKNIDDILIAWVAAFSSFHGGNEVALSRKRKLLSCAGGPATLDAAETAISRAQKLHNDISGASFAADAFFPFTDAPSVLADAGVTCGVVPAGGRNQGRVDEFFRKKILN